MKRMLPSAARTLTSALCIFLLLAAPSFGQRDTLDHSETVFVEGKSVLAGIWHLPPFWRLAKLSLSGATWFVPGWENYCRIESAEPEFTFDCLDLSMPKGRATLDEYGSVHLSWVWCIDSDGCKPTNWVFRGQLQSKTEISGHVGVIYDGRLYQQPESLTITKLALSDATPDRGGQSGFMKKLLEEMASGRVTEPYVRQKLFSSNRNVVPIPADWQSKNLEFLTPDILRSLGKVLAVVYVGDFTPVWGWINQHEPMFSSERSNVYTVEFEHGERLCALHRRSDGVLDQFQCI